MSLDKDMYAEASTEYLHMCLHNFTAVLPALREDLITARHAHYGQRVHELQTTIRRLEHRQEAITAALETRKATT